jgi:excisionase family DNA binding protein
MSQITDAPDTEPLVGMDEVYRRTGIPRQTLYDMVRDGRMPSVDVTQPWHTRRQYKFRLSEVDAMMARLIEAHEARMSARAS